MPEQALGGIPLGFEIVVEDKLSGLSCSTYQDGLISLVPRPSHVFNIAREKSGRPGQSCDVMMTCGHYLLCSLKSPPTHPRTYFTA